MKNERVRVRDLYFNSPICVDSFLFYMLLALCSSMYSFARSEPPNLEQIVKDNDAVVIGDITTAELLVIRPPFKTVDLTIKANHILLKNQTCETVDHNTLSIDTDRSKNLVPVGSRAVTFLKNTGYTLKLTDPDSIFLLTKNGEVNDDGKLLSIDHIFSVIDYRNAHLSENLINLITDETQVLDASICVPLGSVKTINLMKLQKMIDYLVDEQSYDHCQFSQ